MRMRVGKRNFVTESFHSSHAPVKREQELMRVCMRVFSTLIPRSNENKSWCTWWELRVCMRVFTALVPRSNENKSWCTWWELRVCMRGFHNSRAPVKREQELHESGLNITACVSKTLVNSRQNFCMKIISPSKESIFSHRERESNSFHEGGKTSENSRALAKAIDSFRGQ